MKKRDIRRRLGTLFQAVKEYFVEEEPRDKARRTLKDATSILSKTIYQRLALEYELKYRNLTGENRAWCEKTLETLRQAEEQQTEQIVQFREEYRKLALQDLLYAALNEPNGNTFQEAHEALAELSAAVEAEKTLQKIPKLLNIDVQRPGLPEPTLVNDENVTE
jgi:hypothetical protein